MGKYKQMQDQTVKFKQVYLEKIEGLETDDELMKNRLVLRNYLLEYKLNTNKNM